MTAEATIFISHVQLSERSACYEVPTELTQCLLPYVTELRSPPFAARLTTLPGQGQVVVKGSQGPGKPHSSREHMPGFPSDDVTPRPLTTGPIFSEPSRLLMNILKCCSPEPTGAAANVLACCVPGK